MFIAFVGAMDSEIEYMLKALDNVKKEEHSGFDFYIGKRRNNTIVVTSSGIGKVNMAIRITVLLEHYHVDCLINSGIAGSVKEAVGSVCVADSVTYHDFSIPGHRFIPGMPKFFKPTKQLLTQAKNVFSDSVIYGTFITGDKFISSIGQLDDYGPLDDVVAIDMESAAVAQTCYLFSVDYLIIRTISDNLDIKQATKNEVNTSMLSAKKVLDFIDANSR